MTNPAGNDNEWQAAATAQAIKSRYGVTASYLVGVLLFFLPFINVKCNNVKLASATGVELAAGFELEPGKEWKNFGRILGDQPEKANRKSDSPRDQRADSSLDRKDGSSHRFAPDYFLAGTLVMGIFGFIFSLIPFKQKWLCCLIAGWVGITGFIISVFSTFDKTKDFRVDAGFIKLSVNFTIWFFLSVGAFIAGIVLSHRLRTRAQALETEKEINEFIFSSGYETAGPTDN